MGVGGLLGFVENYILVLLYSVVVQSIDSPIVKFMAGLSI